jgi:hypothetical protein
MAVSRDRNIEIDHLFPVPPGIVDAKQAEESQSAYDVPTEVADEYGGALDPTNEEGLSVDTNSPSTTPAPTSFTIVSQKVYLGADGTSLTDVVVDFPDVVGIFDVETRASKA